MASHTFSPPSIQLLRSLRTTRHHHICPASHRQLIRARSIAHHASPTSIPRRPLSTNSRSFAPTPSTLPKTTDRGPKSTEDTVTDFGTMDVLSATPPPTTTIDACLSDGFHFGNGLKISGGSGCLLVSGEAFSWRPWEGRADGKRSMLNKKGQWDVQGEAWGLLDLLWPKPDLLILGLGPSMYPISPETRRLISAMGIRVDVQDTRNAASQFNLLATERGVGSVAAAMIPIGWKEPR
ncbi:hypothetical protein G7Y79_00012g032830 [Physcia stellaris]|nr:hypothetical protein G7Y79_00012g032830 [Physcia stellaris]